MIDNTQDVIDSREVIDRINELERVRFSELDESEKQELHDLRDLAREGKNNSDDWIYGLTMIRDSYFTEYAKELADDLGMILRVAKWPYSYINWEAAAEALQADYFDINFDGVTYWAR